MGLIYGAGLDFEGLHLIKGFVFKRFERDFRPIPQLMHAKPTSILGQASGFMSRMYANNRMYDQYWNAFWIGSGCGSNGYDSRTSGCGLLTVDSRYRNKSRANSVLGYRNNLSRKIPDLIRNWTELDKLYLQGTSMENN